VEKGEPHALLECKLTESLWKTVWKMLKKLKIETPYDPVISVLVVGSNKTITLI